MRYRAKAEGHNYKSTRINSLNSLLLQMKICKQANAAPRSDGAAELKSVAVLVVHWLGSLSNQQCFYLLSKNCRSLHKIEHYRLNKIRKESQRFKKRQLQKFQNHSISFFCKWKFVSFANIEILAPRCGETVELNSISLPLSHTITLFLCDR